MEKAPGSALSRVAVALLAVAVAGAGVVLASEAFLGSPPGRGSDVEPESVDPRVTARVRVGGWPGAIAAGEGAVWVAVHTDREQPGTPGVVRIDPATNQVMARIPLPRAPGQVVTGLGTVWAAGYEAQRGAVIYRIDPATNEVTGVIEGVGAPLANGEGVLWASRHDPENLRSWLARVDPSTGRIDAETLLPITYPPMDVEVSESSVWVRSSEEIVEVDAATNTVLARHELEGYSGIAVGGGAVWAGGWSGGEVVHRLDTRTDQLLEPIPVPGFGIPAVVDRGGVWFLRGASSPDSLCRLNTATFEVDACAPTGEWAEDGGPPPAFDAGTETFWVSNLRETVTRIDLAAAPVPVHPRVEARIEVGTAPAAIAAGEDGVWVAVNEPQTAEGWVVARIDPRTNEVTDRIPLFEATEVAVGAGSVWASGRDRGSGQVLVRINPRRVAVSAQIELGCTRCHLDQIAATPGAIWMTVAHVDDFSSGEVFRVDPATNRVVARIPIEGNPRDLAVGEGAVWVYSLTHFEGCCVAGGTLFRIDSATNAVTATLLPGQVPPHAGISTPPVVVGTGGYAWTSRLPGELVRINQATNRVEEVGISGPFYPFGVGEGGVWFRGGTEDAEPVIGRLNTTTLDVDASVPLDSTAIDATLDAETDTIWVADYERWVTRIDLR
jgi:DNA-binding beta-propeller fold protein YncE